MVGIDVLEEDGAISGPSDTLSAEEKSAERDLTALVNQAEEEQMRLSHQLAVAAAATSVAAASWPLPPNGPRDAALLAVGALAPVAYVLSDMWAMNKRDDRILEEEVGAVAAREADRVKGEVSYCSATWGAREGGGGWS